MRPRAVETIVTPGYFATMRIPLVAGRLFDARDNAETEPVAVVSEALSRRLWNTADGTGRRLRRAGDEPGAWLTVIGVVGEVRKTYTDSLHPDVYLPFEQVPRAFGTVMVRTRTDPLALETRIREAAASADPTLALAEVEPMASMLRDRRGPARVLAGFVGGVAVLGFTLTVLGLAAVVGYLVRLRRREFAVRMTLGARPGQIVRRVFRDAVSMLGVGLGLGLALAWGLAGWSRTVLAGISPRDPLTYGGVVLLVVVVSLGALLVPALRAALVDPSLSLREE
jgi:ABC-type antimicrobial peptide transport system permease subunit